MTTLAARFRRPSVIPGFGLTLGFMIAYPTLIIVASRRRVAYDRPRLG